jgi:hypothetical protein
MTQHWREYDEELLSKAAIAAFKQDFPDRYLVSERSLEGTWTHSAATPDMEGFRVLVQNWETWRREGKKVDLGF